MILAVAALSEATYLSVGKMAVEPTIDNTITVEEEGAANTQYGAISTKTGIMAGRLAVFHFGFCEKGFYFATRTSIPDLPQTLNAEDVVTLTLLPGEKVEKVGGGGEKGGGGGEGGERKSGEPVVFTFKLAERARMLKGIRDFGVKCCEFETIIPFEGCGKMPHLRRGDIPVAPLPRPKAGEKWGFNMSVTFSSEKETAYFHLPAAKGRETGDAGHGAGELATLAYEPDLPSFSLVDFGGREEWRASGCLGGTLRFSAPKGDARILSNSYLFRRQSYSKLDNEPEDDPNMKTYREDVQPLQNLTLKAGQGQDFFWRVWVLSGGTVNLLNIDLKAGERTIYRRRMRFDIATPAKWTDAEGLPNLQLAYYPSLTNRLMLIAHPNRVKDLTGGQIEVVGSKGNVLWSKTLAGKPFLGYTRENTVLGEIPYDDYTVRMTLTNAAGRVYRHDRTFARRHFAWQDAHIGEERMVLPPFKAIKVEKWKGGKVEKWKGGKVEKCDTSTIPPFHSSTSDTISFLQTGYGCKGLFWDAVYAKGENILAAPITLTLNGQEFQVQNVEYKEISDDRVIREVTASSTVPPFHSSTITLTVTQTYEYDGYCWMTLQFDAAAPVEVRELKLVVPYQSKYVKYYNSNWRINYRNGPAPDFTLPQTNGVVWHPTVGWQGWEKMWYAGEIPAPLQTVVWFGGVSRGLTWFIESYRGLSLEKGREPQKLVRDGDVATFEVDLVNKPTVWKNSNRIEFGFHPTPVKPKDPNCYKLANLMYSYACPSNAVFFRGTGGSDFYLHPNTAEMMQFPGDDSSLLKWTFAQKKRDTKLFREKLMEYCEKHADWFRRHRIAPMAYYGCNMNNDRLMGVDMNDCYFDPRQLSSFWPEWEMYKTEWGGNYYYCRDDYFNEYTGSVPKTRRDKLLWDFRTALALGLGGLFYDCYSEGPTWDVVGGDAYFRPDGTLQIAAAQVRAWREIMKRSAVLCHQMGKNLYGRPNVSNHDTNGAFAPVMSFCARSSSTERGSNGGEFPIRFPESYMLVEVLGTPLGKHPAVIVSASQGDRARQERELRSLVALMYAYGHFTISDQGLPANCPWFDQAWNLPFDYGWGRPEIVTHHTFWDEEFQPVKVGMWKGGKVETCDTSKVRVSVAEKKGREALLMFGSLGEEPEDIAFDVSGLNLGAVKYTDALTGEPLAEPKLHFGRFGYRAIRVEKK